MRLPGNRSVLAVVGLAVASMAVGAPTAPAAPDPDEQLVQAVAGGDLPGVTAALDAGAKPGARDAKGRPVLLIAVQSGKSEIAEALLDHEASPNAKDRAGTTALVAASIRGDAKVVGLLLSHGAKVNAVVGKRETALSKAVDTAARIKQGSSIDRYLRTIRLLLDRKADANVDVFGAWDLPGTTPLMRAVMRAKIELAQLLLEHGAKVDVLTVEGDTLLTWLCGKARAEKAFRDEVSLLGTSGERLPEDLTRLLLAHGADVNARAINGMTPLMCAGGQGSWNLTGLFLEKKADVNAVGPNGLTAAMYAVYSGQDGVLKLILDKGANVNARSDDGSTPLLLAVAQHDGARSVELLLERGADVKAKRKDGKTALMLATEPEIVGLLKKKGAR